ncbi:hypothetical protein [Streptomyces sp. 3214.6]|uniref:hypothetical protein n=1 Tax=Streptomyces sp. 3214.6 TaxID=1882757 RepID=UPI00090BF496|nr:hypothetical protein [Streptomyces sp. 3214.6]SHI10487.1 hypothetical protein SAMN05444521_3983 [Streptomyces sp. 3214.6]
METFVAVLALLAMVAVGVLLIHLLNNQHDERIAVFQYGRSRSAVRGSAPSAPQRGRLRPRHRTRTAGK